MSGYWAAKEANRGAKDWSGCCCILLLLIGILLFLHFYLLPILNYGIERGLL